MDIPDFDAYARDLAETYGVPMSAIRSEAEVRKVRKGREQAMAQQRMAQIMLQRAAVAHRLIQFMVEEGRGAPSAHLGSIQRNIGILA